ncbi:MAG: hypothetical protein JXR75_03595 [Rhodobacteraceae bacterium]|nr:hypothetical protein [Paracoccaceae bacterium]
MAVMQANPKPDTQTPPVRSAARWVKGAHVAVQGLSHTYRKSNGLVLDSIKAGP